MPSTARPARLETNLILGIAAGTIGSRNSCAGIFYTGFALTTWEFLIYSNVPLMVIKVLNGLAHLYLVDQDPVGHDVYAHGQLTVCGGA